MGTRRPPVGRINCRKTPKGEKSGEYGIFTAVELYFLLPGKEFTALIPWLEG
jgi:hypothetical protein